MSPDLSPMCVSPGSFYGGLSPPAAVHSSEDKENQDPLLLGKEKKLEVAPAAAAAAPAVSTSKHFGGGRAAVSSAPSGLRRRFRPPLAVVSDTSRRSATPGAAGACCGGGGRFGGRDSDAWATEHTYSRLGVQPESKALAAGGRGVGGGGAGGVISGAGSLLKRRRTLGLGSVASKGLIRGLDGGMLERGSEVGGTGPRSKSLSGKGFFFIPRLCSCGVASSEHYIEWACVGDKVRYRWAMRRHAFVFVTGVALYQLSPLPATAFVHTFVV